MTANLITDVEGVRVGSADDARLGSGVTAILFDEPAAASIAINGGAPGTIGTRAPRCSKPRPISAR